MRATAKQSLAQTGVIGLAGQFKHVAPLAQTLAQTGIIGLAGQFKHVAPGRAWLGNAIASHNGVAPLAQTWIIGLIAHNKPKHQGGQGGLSVRGLRSLFRA
ncbi:MAG: hypothetical protein KAV83_07660 [Desulfobacterales bacterium]|nr:hypothetical protein [Desulfobacterales bacterium]